MASTEFSLEDATRLLLEDGFFAMEDANIGDLVSEMERRGFPYSSEYGLDFCKDHVLGDPVCGMGFSWQGSDPLPAHTNHPRGSIRKVHAWTLAEIR